MHLKGRRLEEDPRYWDNEMDPGAKRARVLFFQHFSRRNRSGVRIGHFHSSLKSRTLEVSPVPRDEEINLGATAPRFVRLRAYNFREGTRTGIGEGRRFETKAGHLRRLENDAYANFRNSFSNRYGHFDKFTKIIVNFLISTKQIVKLRV